MTTTAIPPVLTPVQAAIDNAHAIAWDGCHKIYLAMDAQQANWFQEHYEHVIRRVMLSPLRELDNTNMMIAIAKWWEESCMLRFVSAVKTNHADDYCEPSYTDLVPQGFGWDDDDEDEDEDDWDIWFEEEE